MDANPTFGSKKISKLIPDVPKGTVQADYIAIKREINGVMTPGIIPSNTKKSNGEIIPSNPPDVRTRVEMEDDLALMAYQKAKHAKDGDDKKDWARIYGYFQQVKASRERKDVTQIDARTQTINMDMRRADFDSIYLKCCDECRKRIRDGRGRETEEMGGSKGSSEVISDVKVV